MRIVVDYKEIVQVKDIKVKSAKYLSDYVIRIHFNDETEKLVDFKYFLKNSSHPAINKYLDEEKFKNFDVVNANLNWNDYDLIFPLEDLYQGSIIKNNHETITSSR